MAAVTEIEKKYRVRDPSLIEDFLKSMSYLSSARIVDQYLDTIDGMYYQQGIFIRTRNDQTLDVKFNPDHLKGGACKDHLVCSEYNFQLPFHPSSEELFQSLSRLTGIKKPSPYSFENFVLENKLVPLIALDKIRTSYENEICIIAVDALKDFGVFVEFEAKEGVQDIQKFVESIENLTKGLPLETISSGSVEFALRQANEPLYKKGKYLLNDDDQNPASNTAIA